MIGLACIGLAGAMPSGKRAVCRTTFKKKPGRGIRSRSLTTAHAPLQLRHDLAVRFAVFDAAYITGVEPADKDPQSYIALSSKTLR